MKLYAESGTVYFDYTDVDLKAEEKKTYDYRRFMRETSCWNETGTPQLACLDYKPWSWASEYDNVTDLSWLLCICDGRALCNNIPVDDSFKAFRKATEKRCEELCSVEVAKEERREAEAKWQSLCKYGCGRCKHRKRCGDDYFCKASGDMLPEKNVPGPNGRVFQLFNYTAFPTENCPFNINKNKEIENVQEGTKKAS